MGAAGEKKQQTSSEGIKTTSEKVLTEQKNNKEDVRQAAGMQEFHSLGPAIEEVLWCVISLIEPLLAGGEEKHMLSERC